jgi:hypothetical protein
MADRRDIFALQTLRNRLMAFSRLATAATFPDQTG